MSVETNRANIQANRRRIFDLENQVLFNRSQAYATRALINENAALIQKNYQAAFLGNRQLANQNTDDLFRNRTAIVRNIQAKSDVEVNFKEAMMNKVKLEFLDHRSKLNERVLKASERLADANKERIDINRDVMENNETIAQFNSRVIADNARLLKEGIDASKATPESNAHLIADNKAKIDDIVKRSNANKERISQLFETATKNRESIRANAEAIHERRERILANHSKIHANQQKVAEFVAKL